MTFQAVKQSWNPLKHELYLCTSSLCQRNRIQNCKFHAIHFMWSPMWAKSCGWDNDNKSKAWGSWGTITETRKKTTSGNFATPNILQIQMPQPWCSFSHVTSCSMELRMPPDLKQENSFLAQHVDVWAEGRGTVRGCSTCAGPVGGMARKLSATDVLFGFGTTTISEKQHASKWQCPTQAPGQWDEVTSHRLTGNNWVNSGHFAPTRAVKGGTGELSSQGNWSRCTQSHVSPSPQWSNSPGKTFLRVKMPVPPVSPRTSMSACVQICLENSFTPSGGTFLWQCVTTNLGSVFSLRSRWNWCNWIKLVSSNYLQPSINFLPRLEEDSMWLQLVRSDKIKSPFQSFCCSLHICELEPIILFSIWGGDVWESCFALSKEGGTK